MKGSLVFDDNDKEGLSERRMRLIEYFNNVQDEFAPLYKWQPYAQRYLFNADKNRKDRYSLFFYLVHQGCNYLTAMNWCMAYDYPPRRNGPRELTYVNLSQKDYDDLCGMVKKAQDGSMFKGTRRIIDMNQPTKPPTYT